MADRRYTSKPQALRNPDNIGSTHPVIDALAPADRQVFLTQRLPLTSLRFAHI